MKQEFIMRSIIPFTPIDCQEIQTSTTALNRLVKRLWPTGRTGYYERYSMVHTKK